MASEEWKICPSYPDYEVSTEGAVRRITPACGTRPLRLVKQHKKRDGYMSVVLANGMGGYDSVPVHRLVLRAHIGEPQDGEQCGHRDGNRTNNSLGNLKWCTAAENASDRIKHGTQPRGSEHYRAKINEEDVTAIRADQRTLKVIAEQYGIHFSTVARIKTAKSWSHIR